MKKELKKTIKQLCDDVGTAAAAQKLDDLTEDLTEEYDKRVEAGMAELDAYRDVLKNIDAIREMLESLPKTDEEIERRERECGRKNLERILDKISACMWICTIIVYFSISLNYGGWSMTWLIFLWSSIGQTILSMVKKYNRGRTLKKVFKSGLSGILWLVVTIAYFFFSFATGDWYITWIIFLFGALIQTFLGMLFD